MDDVLSAKSTLSSGSTTALSAFEYKSSSALSTLEVLVVRRAVLTNRGPADVEIGPVLHGAAAQITLAANESLDLGPIMPARVNVVNNDGLSNALVELWMEGEFKETGV